MVKVAVGIILQNESAPGADRVLLCQRRQSARYPLKWEFPGGKLENNEPLEDCLRRELREELGINAEIGSLFHQQHYVYPDSGSYDVSYYLVKTFSGTVTNNVFAHWLWVPVADLHSYDILEGNRDVVKKLLERHGPR